MDSPASTKHMPRLDALRGIAALMVAGFHALGAGGGSVIEQLLMLTLGFFFDGRTGVSIFFVLSGLVLGMSLRRLGPATPGRYARFCSRRFFRLYPAYFVSTLFYLPLYYWIFTRAKNGLWFGHSWFDYYTGNPLTKTQVTENFAFLNQTLNNVTWTLKVEVQAALILPLLHQFSLWFRMKGQVFLLLVLIGLSFGSNSEATRTYLYLFYLGYLIPLILDGLRSIRKPDRVPSVTSLFCIALTLLAASHATRLWQLPNSLGIFSAALGSTLLLLLILFAPSHRLFNLLDHPLSKFLGMISYSFYLFNLVCHDVVERFFSPFVSALPPLLATMILFFVSTLICVGLSWLSYTFIERPGVKLGSRF